MFGRSDAVLNPSGVRIGTAEIYRQVEAMDAVVESIAVGQTWQGDQRIVLFVRLRRGVSLDAALVEEIKARIRGTLTPRHVPATGHRGRRHSAHGVGQDHRARGARG